MQRCIGYIGTAYQWCCLQVRLQGSPTAALEAVAAAVWQLQNFPCLYIYSDADVVIPAASVEAFARVCA